MENKEKSTFEILSAIDVSKHVEKKQGLTYLPWAIAWSIVKKHFPDSTYEVDHVDRDDALGYMVHTSVTINSETLTMWLPVMDGANKSMKKEAYTYKTKYGEKSVAAATTFDINKTIMRCLVKNIAMFGLGIYIYSKEDSPEDSYDPNEKKELPKEKPELVEGTENWNKVVKYVKANKSKTFKTAISAVIDKYKVSKTIESKLSKVHSEK